jgi:hypothetical protein
MTAGMRECSRSTIGLVARFPIGVPDPSADAARLHLPTAPGQRSPSRVCRLASVRGVLKARYNLLGEGGRHPPTRRLLDRQLIGPRRRSWTKPCPAMITLALRSCSSPRIARSRALRRPTDRTGGYLLKESTQIAGDHGQRSPGQPPTPPRAGDGPACPTRRARSSHRERADASVKSSPCSARSPYRAASPPTAGSRSSPNPTASIDRPLGRARG